MTRFLAVMSVVTIVAGFALALTGAATLPGIALILLSLALGLALGAVAAARRARDAIREWRALVSGGGPESVRIVGVEPPRGFVFNRDATFTLEIRGQDGTTKQVQRGISIPLPQAFVWTVLGRIPLPLRGLAEKRELDLPVYRKRRRG